MKDVTMILRKAGGSGAVPSPVRVLMAVLALDGCASIWNAQLEKHTWKYDDTLPPEQTAWVYVHNGILDGKITSCNGIDLSGEEPKKAVVVVPCDTPAVISVSDMGKTLGNINYSVKNVEFSYPFTPRKFYVCALLPYEDETREDTADIAIYEYDALTGVIKWIQNWGDGEEEYRVSRIKTGARFKFKPRLF